MNNLKESENHLITVTNPNSLISEQFKTIRVGVQFASADTTYNSILVTSPEPGSGKSTVSANLAVCFAQNGNKTLFIDADMRKPTGHRKFGLRSNVGLSHILTDSGLEISDVCQQTSIENLTVLTSGVRPPNPNELLASKKMANLMSLLSNQFDQVIIDTPPILASSDALVLTPYVSGAIIVLRSGRTLKGQAKTAVQQLKKTNVPIIGSVLNGMKNNSSSYDYY